MKVTSHDRHERAGERGSAVVVILVLLLGILALTEANNGTLRSLKRELQLIEQRQLLKYGELTVTNSFSRRPTNRPPSFGQPGSAPDRAPGE